MCILEVFYYIKTQRDTYLQDTRPLSSSARIWAGSGGACEEKSTIKLLSQPREQTRRPRDARPRTCKPGALCVETHVPVVIILCTSPTLAGPLPPDPTGPIKTPPFRAV
ncbi:hypothetical protein AVEN_240666-1 [Araneus ventricosus]|uniref:Uncharacterized protein n=1 Tax=Araneus ventricosus TaxID=182803 RepID=A0A4Y2D6D2_ARAVE|nr:hypothetical protein AVEN_240666-1 [Araneus ventricosus]